MNFSPGVLIKYLLSYVKTDWTVKDYPLRVRHQPVPATSLSQELRPIPWWVQIIGWEQMPGTGNTREEAFADLERKLADYKRRGEKLPRPGTRVPIQFAPMVKVRRYERLAGDFFAKILDMDYRHVLITDESSLDDFALSEEQTTELQQKIRDLYRVDVSDITDGNLIRIFERIQQQGY